MRGYLSFFVIAVMSLGLVFLIATRARVAHDAPAEVVEVVAAVDAGPDGASSADAAVASATDAGVQVSVEAGVALVDAGAANVPSRALRVTTLGWELAAAGATFGSADAGGSAPSVELAPEMALEAVEARLARGGEDPAGADVAVLPFPAFVVSYERLRALDPRAFAVVGWSRGREEVHAANGLLKPPPGADEVKFVAYGPGMGSDAAARAAGSDSSTFVGLFALDLLGVAPARIRFVAPGSPDGKGAPYAALNKGAADERKLVLSTSDASRLVPLVLVAPRAEIDRNEGKMRDLARAWLDGLDRAGKDASGVARRLANKENLPLSAGVGGAPEAIALLERLGQIESTSAAEQATWIGPTAKGAVTLASIATHTWQLARAAGLTTSAAPEPLPVDARIVAALAAGPVPSRSDAAADGDAGAFGPVPAKATSLVAYRAVDPQADAASVVAELGFLAEVFPRAAFRVTAKGGEKAARAIASSAREKFGIASSRLATANGEPAGAFAAVEVLALP